MQYKTCSTEKAVTAEMKFDLVVQTYIELQRLVYNVLHCLHDNLQTQKRLLWTNLAS